MWPDRVTMLILEKKKEKNLAVLNNFLGRHQTIVGTARSGLEIERIEPNCGIWEVSIFFILEKSISIPISKI